MLHEDELNELEKSMEQLRTLVRAIEDEQMEATDRLYSDLCKLIDTYDSEYDLLLEDEGYNCADDDDD